MGCEALQRGASKVVAVESHASTARTCEQNLKQTRDGCNTNASIVVIRRDLIRWLSQGWNQAPFDLVYFDPPYQLAIHDQTLSLLRQGGWLNTSSWVICEHASDHDLKAESTWTVVDQRRYGLTSLLFLTPLTHSLHDGIDSKRPQTNL
tara:strand:+ start:718 stop:1164 length:447 start_codon:yes stop_codon:yes gene_type:complete